MHDPFTFANLNYMFNSNIPAFLACTLIELTSLTFLLPFTFVQGGLMTKQI